MHIGRQLITGEDPTQVFSEWMPRGGDSGVFTVELQNAINAQLRVYVYHKNAEETGPGTIAGTIMGLTTTLGLHEETIGPLKELVRYLVDARTVGDGSGAILYRILEPSWFDTARV